VRRLASRLSSVADKHYRKFGINTQIARVLLVLWAKEVASVGELCEATTIDQSTLSHMLKRLMAKQIIVKKREDQDNRTVRVSLTPKGTKLAAICVEVASNYQLKTIASFSVQQVAELRHMLVTMYRNFDDAV